MNNFKIEIDNFSYHVQKIVQIKRDNERKVSWLITDLGEHNASGKSTGGFISRAHAIEYIANLHPQKEE